MRFTHKEIFKGIETCEAVVFYLLDFIAVIKRQSLRSDWNRNGTGILNQKKKKKLIKALIIYHIFPPSTFGMILLSSCHIYNLYKEGDQTETK